MKTLSKTALNEKAVPVFKVHPNATVLYATSDGQFFLNKNRAELHANGNKLSVHDISRPEVEDEPAKEGNADSSLTVDEIKELVDESSDEALLAQLLEDERGGKNRKTAVAAIENRLKELAVPKGEKSGDEKTEKEPKADEQ